MGEVRGGISGGVGALFKDLSQILSYLARRLPPDLVQSLSPIMMADLMPRILNVWLDAAVPSSLDEMEAFEAAIAAARQFCERLTDLGYSGFSELQEWVGSAPRVWLSKCRETALDTVRKKLSQGLGEPRQIERVEKQMVSRSEGKELTAGGPSTTTDQQDWDTAWSDGEEASGDGPGGSSGEKAEAEDDGGDAWGAWTEENEEPAEEEEDPSEDKEKEEPVDDDADGDAAEAWGWGDDGAEGDEAEAEGDGAKGDRAKGDGAKEASKEPSADAPTREMTLRETYNISSMPDPVLSLVSAILEDGAALTSAR